MIDEIRKLYLFQTKSSVKCLHNEIMIITEIFEHGPLPSLNLMKRTGRSISGHNQDLKRLVDIGVLTLTKTEIDKRKRIYDITEDLRTAFADCYKR